MPAQTVYVHVGLPKTGTTYIQSALWESRDRLAAAGCLVPGEGRGASWIAVSDLLGRRPRGDEAPTVEGAWGGLVESVRDWDGDRVILSQELLGSATRSQAQRMVRSLRPCDVHVVVTVRDLARTLPSVWQQEIRKGRTWTWREFVAAVRDPDSGAATAGVAFWLRFDVERILRIWGGVVPPAHIHVVIVPPRGAPADDLLGRFAAATGVDRGILTSARPDVNTAIGLAETEVLRRLNVGLDGALNERQYDRAVVRSVVPALQARATATTGRLPVAHQDWVAAKSEELVAVLQGHPGQVVGDLSDLAAQDERESDRDPDDLEDAELVEPMVDALAALSRSYARYWSRNRRREETESTVLTTRLASRARALSYRVRISILERADHNQVFGRIARAYLKRSSSSS